MRIFAENPAAVMEKYSKEFEDCFIETLSRLHNTKRCHANQVTATAAQPTLEEALGGTKPTNLLSW